MLHPANSLGNLTTRFSINIIPVDEGKIHTQVTTDVRASARIVDLQDHIFRMLQMEMFIGPDLQSSLVILPMRNMPTLDDLKKQDLAVLRTEAYQLNDLPVETVCDLFSVQDLGRVHFLVWLPPANGEPFG